MQALENDQPSTEQTPVWLPECDYLDNAIQNVATASSDDHAGQRNPLNANVIEHAKAMQVLAPQLTWWHRPDAAQHGERFANGHANAMVIGKGGLEERDDVWVGISLIAPDIEYPEHHHPPEEVYLVLSTGHWQQEGGQWHEPGIGGLVYNPPSIRHAMRSGSAPLLATWCLLI